ncbi:hypothetical protein [Flavobacterium lacisediminis]|uniref:Uncharacterized protein n=1 Tax=Flavobacterium lacisediminis TaxID=2989705 RepID=A0ABT3EJ60_9FLAO|nr:hypothetical protein [Flavobacterium lacisediminis]MCW1148618.1 hypothetical protein [Flavobacterium lacisediminis]
MKRYSLEIKEKCIKLIYWNDNSHNLDTKEFKKLDSVRVINTIKFNNGKTEISLFPSSKFNIESLVYDLKKKI